MTSDVQSAIDAIAAGGCVVVVDDEDRENEGDLIMAARHATPERVAFLLRYTSGILCVPMDGERCDALDLPPMTAVNRERHGTAFTISVDAAQAITTGVSASDRARTVRLLAADGTKPTDLVRPGHVFPLRARPGGVLKRAGHTEAAVDLARLAGVEPVGLIGEIAHDDGTMARGEELEQFAERFSFPLISVADLISHRLRSERLVERVASATMPTDLGPFQCVGYRSVVDGLEHVALVHGEIDPSRPVLVRVHSECLTGDVFGSRRCDCGEQLTSALTAITREGSGAVVYLRGHEGRGIGLAHKINAYSLQDGGLDTVDANLALGLPVDSREYGIGAQILLDIGVRQARLMTNNPAKYSGLSGFGISIVERVGLPTTPRVENADYLETKRRRMGHLIDLPVADASLPARARRRP